MHLEWYFHPSQIKKTLTAHSAFVAAKPEWRYSNRLSLYSLAKTAFIPKTNKVSLEAFTKLFLHLKGHWQLIRPAKRVMPCEKIYRLLTQGCKVCSASKPLTLVNLHRTKNAHKKILTCLRVLEKVKNLPNKQPSIMAISKLLHFYNPSLFVIYDGKFIERGVLKEFSKDWTAFHSYPKVEHKTFQRYIQYLYFANHLIREQSHTAQFEIKKHLENKKISPTFKRFAYKYGLIFEFMALGALRRKIQDYNKN